MCRACWEEQGSPTDLPDNAAEVIDLINQLYDQPDGGTGGPLHVALDDFNIEDRYIEPWPGGDYTPETRDLADRIAHLMRPMTEAHRAAVLAERAGWTKPRPRPDHCPFMGRHGAREPITHEITGADRWTAWSCAEHATAVVDHQASIGNIVTTAPIPADVGGAPSR